MNRKFYFDILLAVAIIVILGLAVPSTITGFAVNQIYLSIESSMDVEITLFDYDGFINLDIPEKQNITVEIRNTGTENYTARIEEFIYFYDDSVLNEVAYYYDSEVQLLPGMRRMFKTTFQATRIGYYYIKLKIAYGSKRAEAWGTFYSGYIIPNTTPGGGGGGGGTGTGTGDGWTPAQIYYVPAPSLNLSLEYPEEIEVYPGKSIMTSIKAINGGPNATFHEVRLYVSSSNLLDIEVNPKQVYYLDPNTSTVFLLDIKTPADIPIGEYSIDFDLITREVKKTGTIKANVVPYNITLKEEVEKTILNYEYLITELERQLLEEYLKGTNVSSAESFLELAKQNLQEAKNFYDLMEFERAMKKLDVVKQNLKDTVFHLAQSAFALFVPGFSPIWILIIAIMIGLLFLFVLSRRKKKKPKLLRAVEEET
jgi:hypothetical protein